MAEYIEREATVRTVIDAIVEVLDLHNTVDLIKIANKLRSQPTVDVVEVVKCKDCKHYKLRSQSARWSPNKPCCTRKANVKVDENDFCSYGEKKEGAEE